MFPFLFHFGNRSSLYLCILLLQVCPQLGLCPPAETAVALDAAHTVNDKPTCPLCLLATQSVIDKLKDKKTEVRANLKIFTENYRHHFSCFFVHVNSFMPSCSPLPLFYAKEIHVTKLCKINPKDFDKGVSLK
jgi:hypothetical protein